MSKKNEAESAEKNKNDNGRPQKDEKNTVSDIGKEWILPMVLAVAAAVLIKWQVMDVYSIPTGSMEPTLHGVPYSGDRVFCNKTAYFFRKEHEPKRFEVFVFVYTGDGPHKGENYIKRCVGFPGETVYVTNGDLYVGKGIDQNIPAIIAKKSLELQDSIWIPVNLQNFDKSRKDGFSYYWKNTGSDSWKISDGTLNTTKGGERFEFVPRWDSQLGGVVDRHIKRQVVVFDCPECGEMLAKTVTSQQLSAYCPKCSKFMTESDIEMDSFLHPGISGRDETPPRGSPFHTVRDLRLSLDISSTEKTQSENLGNLEMGLKADSDVYTVRLPLPGSSGDTNTGQSNKVRLFHNDEEIEEASASLSLPYHGKYKCEFFRADQTLYLRVDGKVIVKYDLADKWPGKYSHTTESSAFFAIDGEGMLSIDNLAVDRDLYYFFAPPRRGSTGSHGYFTKFPEIKNRGELHYFMNDNACYILPEGGYLAMGDNSPTSADSRYWGPVQAEKLVGPALFVWWPPSRIRIIK